MSQILRLTRKINDLAYQVESYGDQGAARELDCLRVELSQVLRSERKVAC